MSAAPSLADAGAGAGGVCVALVVLAGLVGLLIVFGPGGWRSGGG